MKNVIELLTKQYDSFIDQQRDWNFFCGLADYVNFINNNPEFNPPIKKFQEQKARELDAIHKAEDEAVEELQEVKKKILALTKLEAVEMTAPTIPLEEAIAQLKDYEEGRKKPDWYKSTSLEYGLRDIIEVLCKSGNKSLLDEFLEPMEGSADQIVPWYYLSEKFKIRENLSRRFRNKKETELWGAYEQVKGVYTGVYKGDDYVKTIEERGDDPSDYQKILDELDEMKNDGDMPLFARRNERSEFRASIKELKRENYKLYASRLHNYFLQELSQEKERGGKAILYLSEDGDLYRKPKTKYCYEMEKESNRHRIVRYLAQKTGYQKTAEIMAATDSTSIKAVSGAIGRIRSLITHSLEIDGQDLIESKKGSGYRINPKYKIIETDD